MSVGREREREMVNVGRERGRVLGEREEGERERERERVCVCGKRLWGVSVSGSNFIWAAGECDELVREGGSECKKIRELFHITS